MTDEEIKAIDKLKKSANYFVMPIYETKIILNLIEKQSKEIEHQIEKRANQKKELAILNAKQVEFNKLVNTVNSYKGQFKRQQKEIEELKNTETYKLAIIDKDNYISKDKIKPIQIIDLDGKIHNVYKIEEE